MSFKKGEFIALNDVVDTPQNNIEKLNNIASKYAIGRDIHVGDTIVGMKGRVGFEAEHCIDYHKSTPFVGKAHPHKMAIATQSIFGKFLWDAFA